MSSVDEKIAEAIKLADAASAGPWKYDYGNWEVEQEDTRAGIFSTSPSHVDDNNIRCSYGESHDNGVFAAASRTLVPQLAKALKLAVDLIKSNCKCTGTLKNPESCVNCDTIRDINRLLDEEN